MITIPNQTSCMELGHSTIFPTANLTLIANELLALRKQGSHFVTAQNFQNLKFSEEEIAQWAKPNYVTIGCIIIAALFFTYLAYKLYKHCTKRTSMFTKLPLHDAPNHLDRKECLEALELKAQTKMFEQDEKENRPNNIKIGDRVLKKVNMGDYTIISPTDPVAPPMYPDINERPTQY
jgi:hypothetical protein